MSLLGIMPSYGIDGAQSSHQGIVSFYAQNPQGSVAKVIESALCQSRLGALSIPEGEQGFNAACQARVCLRI